MPSFTHTLTEDFWTSWRGSAGWQAEIVRGCWMLKPHTATFSYGSFSGKSGAAVAFQDLYPSISQYPPFTLACFPSLLSYTFPCVLISFLPLFLPWFLLLHSVHLSPFCFALHHPSLADWVYSPRATSARLSATDLLIGFSLCSKHSVGLGGSSLTHWWTCT